MQFDAARRGERGEGREKAGRGWATKGGLDEQCTHHGRGGGSRGVRGFRFQTPSGWMASAIFSARLL